MGVSYRLKGELSRSLEHIYKALQIAEDNNYKSEIAYCFMRLSLVFSDLKDFDKAISLIQKSFQIFGSEKRIRVNAINNLQSSNNFEGLNKLDTAWYYAEKAYNQLDIIEDLTSDVCRSAGNIQFKTGNRLLSFKFYKEAYDYALSQNDYRSISLVYAQLAIVYRKENNRDSSIYYAKQGLEYAQRSSNRRGILACGNLLAEIYEVENPADALRFYKIAAEAKEGLFGTGNLQAIQALLVKEEERQNEIERAKAVYQAQLKQYGLLGIVVVFLVVALPLYRNNQNRKKTNEQLLQQNAEIEKQKTNVEHALSELKSTQSQLIQSEKMASLGELTAGIAHEIQNPLNFVNNFSEVNKELVDELKTELATGNMQLANEIADDIKANEEKINHHGKRAADIVKGMLQHSRSSSGVKEPTDINALCDEYLRLSYHGLRAKDKSFNASFKTDFDNSLGKVNVISQDIGRVVLNLLTNAFYVVNEKKQQNISGYEPTVTVSTKKLGDKVEIKVKDNGNGIPQKVLDKIFQPFFTTKPTGQGTGLGLSLSYDIIKAHGGELRVETKEGEGSTFVITIAS